MRRKKDGEKSGLSDKNDKNSATENGVGDEPNFSDPGGYVDDISDEDLLGDILRTKPTETDGVEAVIVVDGIPQVGPDRFDKLSGVINKFFSRIGTIVNEYYPKTEAGVTKGYVFLEYSSQVHAQEAVKLTHMHKLDKQHTFLVNLFTDFAKYEDLPEQWETPTPAPYKETGNKQYFLLEPDAYDQFAVTVGNGQALQIWLNSQPEPTKIEERNRWTETYCKWSPLGSYLATFHRKGLALWGGPNFEQLHRFSHSNVQFIEFSPQEKYLVTYSPPTQDSHGQEQKALIIWDVRTSLERRSFGMESGQSMWPIFRWSYNDRYFARIVDDVLSVYTTPSFGLLDKKSVKIPGVRDFSWSPSDNILAYWVAEDKDVPARVTLLEIPSRVEIRSKNLFNVADCKIHWQKSGEYLCVKVDRYSKVRKEKNDVKYAGMFYNFEIFHMKMKQIPVDSVEIKETIHAFAWEPVGSKFAIIHGDAPNINVSFYGVTTGMAPSLLKRFEKRNCNHLFWAPCGQFIVLAGLRNMSGVLEFVDSNDFTSMNVADHYTCSDVEWDPTGRYVATAVSSWKTKMDTGYWLWTFQGRLVKRVYLDNFCQLLWRPRPPTLLPLEKQKEVKKNLKKYSGQFESKDRLRLTKASKELVEKRQRLMQEFEEFKKKRQQTWMANKPRRLELRNGMDTDELDSDTTNLEEEIVEFLVKEETTVID